VFVYLVLLSIVGAVTSLNTFCWISHVSRVLSKQDILPTNYDKKLSCDLAALDIISGMYGISPNISNIGLSVCRSQLSCAKMAELVEMVFGGKYTTLLQSLDTR